MSFLRTYFRALAMLGRERGLTVLLVAASVAIGLIQLAEPVLFGRVVDALSRQGDPFSVVWLWAGLGGFSILASVIVAMFADRMSHRLRLAAMSDAFERAITLPLSYHASSGSAPVMRAILMGGDTLFGLWLSFLREHLVAVVSLLFLVPTAISIDWRMAALLGCLAVVYAGLNVFVIRRTSEGQSEVESHHQRVSGQMGDVIGNISVVQSYARLSAESAMLRDLMNQLLAAQYPVLTWWAVLTVLSRAAGTITMVAVFLLGSVLVMRGEASVGEIVSFVGFAGLLISKLDQLSSFVGRIFMQAPVLRTYFSLLDTPAEVKETPGAPALEVTKGHVAYESVSYRFPKSRQGVFDLSFEARPGETVAIVGPTGSGKTTTLALLQRLRDPQSGRIAIDGTDIRAVSLNSLRHAIGVVFQDAGLFNRSIADNIRVGRPGATQAEIEAAARKAQAHDFIRKKPGGYRFVIGERGAALSGGERQRIAIARAILKGSPVLILDEATSALDVETEARIKQALDAVRKGRTTFIIAHRLSTIVDADRIVVLENGRVAEQGSYAKLAAGKGPFARMVKQGGFTVPESEEGEAKRQSAAPRAGSKRRPGKAVAAATKTRKQERRSGQ